MSKCNKCNQTIEWVKTEKGWRPYNPVEGTWHFDTCKPLPQEQKTETQKLKELRSRFDDNNQDWQLEEDSYDSI